MDEDSKMMEQAETGLGVPKGTFHWPWPKKPLGKPTGKGNAKAGQKPSGSKPQKGQKSQKSRQGNKHKKGDFGSWM